MHEAFGIFNSAEVAVATRKEYLMHIRAAHEGWAIRFAGFVK